MKGFFVNCYIHCSMQSLHGHRHLCTTNRKLIQREKAAKFATKQKKNENLPEFKTLLWKMYKVAHPDLVSLQNYFLIIRFIINIYM